jgi:hypothetical protein
MRWMVMLAAAGLMGVSEARAQSITTVAGTRGKDRISRRTACCHPHQVRR